MSHWLTGLNASSTIKSRICPYFSVVISRSCWSIKSLQNCLTIFSYCNLEPSFFSFCDWNFYITHTNYSFANGYHIGLINKWLVYIHENVEPVLSLVPQCKGSGIAQVVETSNAESPTPVYVYRKHS